ncbi:MAG: PorV/PorQ family protein [Elusimicrobiota bacterium]
MKHFRFWIFIFHFSFFIFHCLYATEPTAEFLRINPAATASAIGGADVAYSGKVDSIYSNPSGLGTLAKPQLLTAYSSYIQNIKLAGLAFAKPIGKKGENVVGLAVLYLGLTGLEVYNDDSGATGETASSSNFGFTLSWARNIRNNLTAGLSIKQVHQNYDEVTSDGFCADVGVLYKSNNLSLGLSFQNFGPEIDNQKLPSTIRLGTNYTDYIFNNIPIETSVEIEKPIYSDIKFKAGAEYWITPNVNLRCGYEDLKAAGTFSGISGGLGLKTFYQQSYIEENMKKIDVNLDYAFTYFGELGNIHKVSIGFEF